MTSRSNPARPASQEPGVARTIDAIMPGERLIFVDSIGAMADRFDSLEHQRPATCGAYTLSYLLPALGFTSRDGHDLAAEDYLAHLAGVVIDESEVAPSDEVAMQVASGQLTERDALASFGRIWYRYPVRSSSDPIVAGTSPTGVARAVAMASGGRLVTIPVASRIDDGSVQLTADRWTALLDVLAGRTADWRWHAVFNYEANQLLKPSGPSYQPAALRDRTAETRVPLDDWGVGHFAGLAGLWRMSATNRWWLLLFDTYKERGFSGYEPQPAELMRRGLVREDGREGGLLLVIPADVLGEVGAVISSLGLVERMWSNGSPEPEGWSWEHSS